MNAYRVRSSFHDRYKEALRELVEAKTKGLATTPRAIAETPKVINLMEAMKRLKRQGFSPRLLITDKLRSNASAFWRLGLSCPY